MNQFYAFTAVAVILASTASAEVTPVADRMARDYVPNGVRAGSFLVIPKVDLDATYDDNIYATKNNTKSDFIATVRPEVTVKSNWNRHSVGAVARGEINRYMDHNDEDTENFFVGADGRVDVMRDTSIGGGVSYARSHEDRGNPNAVGTTTEPTEVNTTTAKLGAYRSLGRANARLETDAKDIDYKNGRTSAGAVVNNNIRDRREYGTSLRLGYQFTPVIEAYVKGGFDNRVYATKAPTNRSNTGTNTVVGAVFDITGKTKGDVFAGYEKRNYKGTLKDISEPTFGAKVTWNASELTTVLANVTRNIEETTLGSSSGYVSTDYGVDVQHGLTRQILLKGGVHYTNNEYQGTAANLRNDDIITAKLGAKYYLNNCWSVGPEYTFTDRNSNITNSDYSRNAVMLRLTATY